MRRSRQVFALLLPVLASCQPDLGPTGSILAEETILAIRAEPAEVMPGQTVTYRALVASPSGTVRDAHVDWSYCTASKPPSEDNVASTICLGDTAIVQLGAGPMASGPIPFDACARFGPDVPPQPVGQPPLRPRDPDVTGGYYQPVRARLDGLTAFGLERIQCNLAGASSDVAAEYRASYSPNVNPSIGSVAAYNGAQRIDETSIPPATKIRLVVTWPEGASERYPVFDPKMNALVEHRESLRVSWFATGGAFDTDHTGTTGESLETSSENGWTSPLSGEVHVWVVLRDERGGVDFSESIFRVRDAP